MSLTDAPTLTATDGCMPLCQDIVSCGQTYGGCFTSCPGIPTPEFTVPDYVVSACIALGSTTVSTTSQPEPTDTITATDVLSVSTATATATETNTETINTVGTQTGVFTILTETTGFTTQLSTSNATIVPTNGTTTGLLAPTNTERSGAERGIGAVKIGMVFGTLIAAILAGVSIL